MKEKAGRPHKGSLVGTVLAGSWRPTVSSSIAIDEKQLDEVAPLLNASGAAALGWWRIRQTNLKTTASGEVLQQGYRLQSLQASIHERQIQKIFRLMRAAGVEPIIVKGWVAAVLYPDSALRPYGDIDLLVRSQDLKVAESVLESDEASECWVDLHKRFYELNDRSVEELFERSRLVDLEGEQIRILAQEDHLALLTIHLLKHGAWRPVWLCDIGAALESIPTGFDWQICFGRDQRRRHWISVAIALSRDLLDAQLDRFPGEMQEKVPSWLLKSVLNQWSRLFPANHLPVQAPPLMVGSLSSPRQVLNATRERWPDPITATFNLNGRFGTLPRLPYQLGEFGYRAGRFLKSLPKTLLSG
jgi:Uncharacterised nucleotidyltransferase